MQQWRITPYKESPYFETPCHTKTLWRFMHIDKFMSMINKQLLHFPNITLFHDKDKYEGELSDKSRTTVYETNLLDKKNRPIKRDEAFQQNKNMMDEQTESKGIYMQTNTKSELSYPLSLSVNIS